MFVEDYLDGPQETTSRRKNVNFTEFQDLKAGTKKQLNEIKERKLKKNKCLGDA